MSRNKEEMNDRGSRGQRTGGRSQLQKVHLLEIIVLASKKL